jgi:fucose permease
MLTGAVGLFLLSTLNEGSSSGTAAGYLFVLGTGLGLVMQTVVLATQNSVHVRDIGAATSSTTFFRSMGGSFGTAVFGVLLSDRLGDELAKGTVDPAVAAGGQPNISRIQELPQDQQTFVVHAFVEAMSYVFLAAAAVMLLGWLLTFALKEQRLRATARPVGPSEDAEGFLLGRAARY